MAKAICNELTLKVSASQRQLADQFSAGKSCKAEFMEAFEENQRSHKKRHFIGKLIKL